ncbi:high affinity copper uptake protein 1 [Ceratitis capitata]|uniref:high affinity copper uptake protein 1 n=1 Tax=Ceratitis capitata TaxID=7213 RepID=UPI00061886AF|nr:high affinity copper uptake protein 1 [Ceratitis capitata]
MKNRHFSLAKLKFQKVTMESGHHHQESSKMQDGCPHIMLFHGGHCEQILWKTWTVKTILEFTLSAFAVFLIAFLYEALRFLRQFLVRRELERSANKDKERTDVVCSTIAGLKNKQLFKQIVAPQHLIQTVLFLFQVTLSMLLMLIFMSFNYWLCLSVILGLAFGYFLFGWIKDDAYDSDCCN